MGDMTAIRNACVARGLVAAGASEFVYTVPEGFVLLLKSVYNRASGTGEIALQVAAISADGSVPVYVVNTPLGTTEIPAWEGWLALNGGDQILVGAPGAAMWYWISGALLPYASALPTGAIAG